MKKVTLNTKNFPLFSFYNKQLFVKLDIQTEYKEETKFKNSAFVKTGRQVPTGNYTAYELLVKEGQWRDLSWYEIEKQVLTKIDTYVKNSILYCFVWNGFKVWLSTENQQNYASWVTAVKSNPEILPLVAKFNDAKTNAEVLYNFTSVEELNDFYSKAIKFINDKVNLGRTLKDYFIKNKSLYKESFDKMVN